MAGVRADRVRTVVAPLAFLALALGLWEASVINSILGVERFALPFPSDIASALSSERAALTSAFRETIAAVILGFVLGNSAGLLLAIGLLRLRTEVARRIGAVAASVQALPIVATAPVLSLWILEPLWLKASVVVVMSFPPMLVFAYRGVTSVGPNALDLAASYNASWWQVLISWRLPAAVPYLFAALKYTVVLALIGVVIAEILVAHDGLGIQIDIAMQRFKVAEAWAAVTVLAMIGIAAYLVVAAVERLMFPWSLRHDRH